MGGGCAPDRSRTPLTQRPIDTDLALPDGGAQGSADRGDAARLGLQFGHAYQPIVDMRSRSTFAHATWLRGPNGEDAATVLSQVTEPNRRRFDRACRTLAIKGAAQLGIRELVSIVCVPHAADDPALSVCTTFEAARRHRLPAGQIICTVPESDRADDAGRVVALLREAKRCGFKTAIDDFGSGFAGLTLLAAFQPDLVKLGVAFTRRLASSRPRQVIVRGLVRLCDDLGIRLIATGVETAAERDSLIDAGVGLMQGDWFAQPAFQRLAVIEPSAYWAAHTNPVQTPMCD
jgi:EAL domain-containing protein (putative c-di-GMP-specific phosphodiesterase class I)